LPDVVDTDETWTDDALLATAAAYPGVGSDADLPEVDRFRAAVSRLVAKTIAQEVGEVRTGLGVFLLEPLGAPGDFAELSTRVPMLDRGGEELVGRVWFVTHLVTVGTWVPADFDTHDEFFKYVTDDVGLGEAPTVVYVPGDGDPELRFYAAGLADPETVERLQIAARPISLEEIFQRIEPLYKNQLVTPGVQQRSSSVWARAAAGRASSSAEDTLSSLLTAGLNTAFPHCKVRTEQPLPAGRLDIEIEERIPNVPGAIMRHAILELKVLRGRRENGVAVSAATCRAAVAEGVLQAAAYRLDKGALAAALCCFDMRPNFAGAQCFADVLETAAQTDVVLQVWHLFDSAEKYRQYLFASGALVPGAAAGGAKGDA
jgi:hypothetical protein